MSAKNNKNKSKIKRINNKGIDLEQNIQRTKDVTISDQELKVETYMGPIPDPTTLTKYKDIDPALVELIIHLARTQSDNRHANERNIIEKNWENNLLNHEKEKRGAYLGIFSLFMILATIVVAIIYGETTMGSILAGAVISVSGIFVMGKNIFKKDKNSSLPEKASSKKNINLD